jgi:hypothetical protein
MIKRYLMPAVLVLGALWPAKGEAAAGVAEQARNAYQIFLGGYFQSEEFMTNYVKIILDGLDGRWAFLPPGTENVPQICERVAFEVTVPSPYSFVMRRLHKDDPERVVDYRYVSVANNWFDEQADPEQQLRWLNLDEVDEADDTLAGARRSVLANINGRVTVWRPSPDILVIQRLYQPPQIFGRCPIGG